MEECKATPLYCNTKHNKKKVGKNVFSWFTRNKLIPKAIINASLLGNPGTHSTTKEGEGCMAYTGMRRCTRYCSGYLSVQNTAYYFVRVCLNYIEGIACTNSVIKLRSFIFVLRRLG